MDRAFTGTAYGKTNAADCFRFVAGQTLAQRLYQYDTSGNISQIESDLGITDYGYDKLDRLTEATPDTALQALGLPQEQYGYDPVGNRTSSAHQPGFWRYNADNQLTEYPSLQPFSLGALPVDTDVSYTPHGHTEKETNRIGTKEYDYNAAERLIRFANTLQGQTTPQLEADYRYDPFGRRIAKTMTQGSQTGTVWFIYNEQGLMAEANEQGELTKAYGFNPTTGQQGLWSTDPIWQASIAEHQLTSEQTQYHYLHTDHLYTPMLATDATGDISWKAVQEAFGAINALQHQSRISMNLRFPGQYYDQETGTHYSFQRIMQSYRSSSVSAPALRRGMPMRWRRSHSDLRLIPRRLASSVSVIWSWWSSTNC